MNNLPYEYILISQRELICKRNGRCCSSTELLALHTSQANKEVNHTGDNNGGGGVGEVGGG